jgi:hypothetical protein
MDLQVGGTSKFKVDKTGTVTVASSGGITAATNLVFRTSSNSSISFFGSDTSNDFVSITTQANGVLSLRSAGQFGFTALTYSNASLDTILTRKAAANIRFGAADAAAPVAQTLSVQSVVAGTTNIAGTDLTITGSQGTGTGAGGKITFSAANAGTSGSTQNPLVDRMRISGIDANTALFELNSNGGYVNFTVGGNTLAIATGTGSSNNHDVQLPGLTSYRIGQGYGVAIGTGASMPVLQGGVQEASDTLAQRRTTNPQTFRVYNTYTDASNYERGAISWSSNQLQIGTESAGTGSARDLYLVSGSGNIRVGRSGGNANLLFFNDNAADIGASGANRPRSIYAGSDIYAQSNTAGFYLGTSSDVALLWDAANTLAMRRSTNAQTFNIYNTYTTTTNYERGFLKWNTNVLQIGTEKGSGGGTARDLAFQTDGTTRLTISASGVTTATAIDVISQGGLTFASTYELRCTSRLRVSSPADGNLLVTNWATGDFGRLQFGGTTSSFPALKRSATALQCRLADDTAFAPLEASTIGTSTAYTVATLPAAGTAGRRAYVTDATAPTWLGALTGGGAVKCPVFDNGTAWVAG